MTRASEPHPISGQPVGLPVDATPAQRPGPVTLEGRYGRVEKLAARHGTGLWRAYAGHDHIWTYLAAYGPFADETGFRKWFDSRLLLEDPYSYAIVDGGGIIAANEVSYLPRWSGGYRPSCTLRSNCIKPRAATTPTAIPTSVSNRPSFRTSFRMSTARAPRAMRTPM